MGNSRNLRETRAPLARVVVHRSGNWQPSWRADWLGKGSKQWFVHELRVRDRQTVGRTEKKVKHVLCRGERD